ncbi:uncharacterized protein LOC122866493 isoform X2 [Siniperca chuatsi]|uniref:uncharacterized protein LOC122866493 isoform X2 n=1 Tax=Siniperca chuatsi TaxID=119488 RepID=UPI001CE043EB|nr:uncharacterized protein LOC122866493 isoform X2 [Siniperca chuatsi]
MSCCSCCCCGAPGGELLEGQRSRVSPAGIRKKEPVRGGQEQEAAGGQEEERSRNMDISLLRQQYRCTTESQKRRTQVLLFRKVSVELLEAVSVVPVAQGLTSPWEPNSSSPPAITFDLDPATCDPWHVHLGLHRRSCPGGSAQLSASSRRSSSFSEAGGSRRDADSTSPCCSFNSTSEEDLLNTDRSGGDPEKMDPVQVSVSEQNPSEDHPAGALTSSDESSTPVASITCSPSSSTTSLHEDLKENQPAGSKTCDGVLQTGSTSALRGSGKFSSPALRFTRQLSVGGVGSPTGVHQNQNYHPFPNRKTPRISEAARRLGMYSSF